MRDKDFIDQIHNTWGPFIMPITDETKRLWSRQALAGISVPEPVCAKIEELTATEEA